MQKYALEINNQIFNDKFLNVRKIHKTYTELFRQIISKNAALFTLYIFLPVS